ETLCANGERIREGDYLQLEVSDSGYGITPETRARLFDPFFTTKSPGRGLGLPVVQGIVRNLEGGITVTSEPGKGTTVRVLLPSSVKGAPAAYGPAPSSLTTILIVEDETQLREPVAKMLRNRGFSVVEAADGNAGLAAIRA